MLWLGIRFPTFALDIFTRSKKLCATHQDSDSEKPTAVTEHNRVIICNTSATAIGIEPGMALATVYALSKEICTIERDAEQELQILKQLAQWAYQFTPQVTLHQPNGLLLDIHGSLKLYKGLDNLLLCVTKALKSKCFHYHIALAHTAKAAWVLCHSSLSNNSIINAVFDYETQTIQKKKLLHVLNQVAIQYLDITDVEKEKIDNLGIQTIGELLRLPQAAIGKRFGMELIIYLQQLSGERSDIQDSISVEDKFYSHLYFIDGLTSCDMLLLPIKKLLVELANFLTARQLHCTKITWQLHLLNKKMSSIEITLMRPQNNYLTFLYLTRLKLDHVVVTDPIEMISLTTNNFSAAQLKNHVLFDDPNNQHDLAELLNKLSARLGKDACHGIQVNNEHIPELAWQPCDSYKLLENDKQPATIEQQALPTHPLWLLEKRKIIRTNKNHLYWHGKLTLLNGPERIDNYWWRQHQQRDYFIARHANGSLYWIYRDLKNNHWYLQGVFG